MRTRSGKILHASSTSTGKHPRVRLRKLHRPDGAGIDVSCPGQPSPSPGRDLTAHPPRDGPSTPPLPPEILHAIATELDTASLARFLGVSPVFWEIGASLLYRSLTLEESQFKRLIRGALHSKYRLGNYRGSALLALRRQGISRLSERMQRAFCFIEKLHIRHSVCFSGVTNLWDATIPGVPLFPNVRQLCFAETSRPVNPDARLYWPKPPTDDVIIFNNPDVCIKGSWGMSRVKYYPIRSAKRFSCHLSPIYFLWKPELQTFESYHLYHGNSDPHGPRLLTNYRHVMDSCPALPRPIQMCFRMEDQALMDALTKLDTRPRRDDQVPDGGQTERFVCLFNDDVPPCSVCGRSHGRLKSDTTEKSCE